MRFGLTCKMENEGKNYEINSVFSMHWKRCAGAHSGRRRKRQWRDGLREQKPQQRTAKVQAARPTNTGRTMSARIVTFRPRNIGSGRNGEAAPPVLQSIAQPGPGVGRRQLQLGSETSPGTTGCVSGNSQRNQGISLRDVTFAVKNTGCPAGVNHASYSSRAKSCGESRQEYRG